MHLDKYLRIFEVSDIAAKVGMWDIQGTRKWLHNCSYSPLIRPPRRVRQVRTGL